MSLTIHLSDISSEGLAIQHEVEPDEIALPLDDGEILNPLHCAGQVISSDDRMAHFEGTLNGQVARTCVRCLTTFSERLCLFFDADFRRASPLPDSSKKMKKGSRRHDLSIDKEQEEDFETYPIIDDQINLLPSIRECLILSTSSHPLCNESCAGLCQLCGTNLNEAMCGCCSPVIASSSIENDMAPYLKKTSSKPIPSLARKRM